MERATFETRLRTAARGAVQFTRDHFVRQPLPDEFALLVVPNCSFDDNPRVSDEEVFPDESLPAGQSHGPWSVGEAVEFLWRAGKVPEWIDISVVAEDGIRSLVQCRCCGRFSADEERLYHQHAGLAPFHVVSPFLPPGWLSVEASGRFNLYWERQAGAEPGAATDGGA